MPNTNLQTPTLAEIVTRIRDDFDAQLPVEGAKIRRSFLYVTASVLAGAVHSLYGLAKQISKNIVFDTIEDAEILERVASIWDLQRDPGTASRGLFRFSGVAGTPIPISTQIERDSGFIYATDAAATIGGGGTVDVYATATEPGTAGNITDVSETVAITTPIAGVSSTVAVQSAPSNGTDQESITTLRTRLLNEIRTPRQGGAVADYVAWIFEAPGLSADVSRVWIGQELGDGSVTAWFTVEDTGSGVIPTAGDIAIAGNYITETDSSGHRTRLPVTASFSVGAPVAVPCNFTIGLAANTSANQAIVTAELNTMFRDNANVKRTGYSGDTIKNAEIHKALARSMSQGVEYYTLTAVDGGSGSDDITTSSVGDLRTLGVITWVGL